MLAELRLLLLSPPRLFIRLCRAVPAEGWRFAWKRIPLFMLLFTLYCLLNLLHMAGYLLDEILFHSYRKTRIKEPVFILGIPRSGTTLLQRILAESPGFTTLQTWEALLAPSISERYLFCLLGLLLRPFGPVMGKLRQVLLRQMDQVHEIRLTEAEEDFLLLLPLDACFLLVLLCPGEGHYWKLAAFDTAFDENYRNAVMHYYRRCLQKHLYFHGKHAAGDCTRRDLRMLSKNPSFTPLLQSLTQTFPDARFIACVRPPREVIPSQLNSLRPVMGLLGKGYLNSRFEQRLTEVLKSYYAVVGGHMGKGSFSVIALHELQNNLRMTVTKLLQTLAVPVSADFSRSLEQHDVRARAYKSPYPTPGEHSEAGAGKLDAVFSRVWPLRTGTTGGVP